MSGFFLYTSNYLENLAHRLASLLSVPSDGPMAQELVVVHGKGMGQWAAMAVAGHNSICANTRFPFPNAFLDMLFEEITPSPPEISPYHPEVLTFIISRMLGACKDQEPFAPIGNYLDDNDPFKCYQLSEKIADIFDQYLIFRPDMMDEWEKGNGDFWQALLWRRITQEIHIPHRAAQRKALLGAIKNNPESLKKIPSRIFLFGISYLPPFHMEVLAALSTIREIHFFTVNPCCEYWGDIVTDKEKMKIKGRYASDRVADTGLYLETGNPLLSSLGIMGREFFNMLLGFEGQTRECYQDPSEETLLGAIQSDILHLRDRTRTRRALSPGDPEEITPPRDTSIQIHSCHSPLREVEVLHDQMLALFEENPDLLPKDILVMTPDITVYEPFVHGVFGTRTHEGEKIPFHVADRRILKESAVNQGFLLLLEVVTGRFEVTDVMALLDIPGVKEKFGILESDMPRIEDRIADTAIRWGIDGNHRKALGLPDFSENTWKAGFDRLLLGYAMAGNSHRLFADILPDDNMEGSETRTMGNFMHFFSRLVHLGQELERERSLDQWTGVLSMALDEFFAVRDDLVEDRQTLQRAFDDLTVYRNASGNTDAFHLPVIASFLKKRLSGDHAGVGFVTGGVTFCTLLPFRSIPAKAICLLGMNSDAFPGNYFQPSFDLVTAFPRPGDRVKRNDDKYLFLQALISARQTFYISYVGQNIRDNAPFPPCVIVTELMDYIAKGFGIPEADMITRHRLQAFSDAYFLPESKLFSYSRENHETCAAVTDPDRQKEGDHVFFLRPLSTPREDFRMVDLIDLGFFYSNPSQYILENRLGIFLKDEVGRFAAEEPFSLTGLNRYQVGQDVVAGGLARADFDHLMAVQRALGRLPHGSPGEVCFAKEGALARAHVDQILSYGESPDLEPLAFRVPVNDFWLTGNLLNVCKDYCLKSIYAMGKPKYLLRAWISHLGLCLAAREGYPRTTLVVCRDVTWRFHPVEDGPRIFAELVAMYWQGLLTPAVFFPEVSFVYAEMMLVKKKTETEALAASLRRWKGNDFLTGEMDDPYVRLCFPGPSLERQIKDGRFQETALRVFGPLFAHYEKIVNREPKTVN